MEFLMPTSRNPATVAPSRLPKSWAWARANFCAFASGLVFFCLGCNAATGQTISHEYPLKAVFLLNFAQFTDWPTNAFDQPDSPLVIGVLGDDPFGPLLDDVVRGETVNGRKFVVERYRRFEDIKTCHILFISQSEIKRLDKIMESLKGKPILTVSEFDGSTYRGVCLRFITENNKIHFQINTEALQAAKLTMSSKILRVAQLVPPPPR
jgi:hypothetical protein